MAYTYVDAEDITPTWGTFRMVRHELGGTQGCLLYTSDAADE